ncbi:hypothetical protein LUQ84_003395 [Hamiltosporidium tvaerminnensis]|nr:hypothetical protein LUQ84_003395 [Hamiltosporidium tvaerminnensis]
MTEADSPTLKNIKSTDWKIRLQTYQSLQPHEISPEIIKTLTKETTLPVLEAGVSILLIYKPSYLYPHIVPLFCNLCTSKVSLKSKILEIFFYILNNLSKEVLFDLFIFLENKNPKLVCSVIVLIKDVTKQYGVIYNVEGVNLSNLLQHSDSSVRKEAMVLIIEIYKTYKERVLIYIKGVKPIILKNLEEEFLKIREMSKIEGSEGVSKLEGVSDCASKQQGVSNSIDKQQGVSYSTHEQQGVSNSTHEQHPISHSIYKQQGVSNSIDKQHPVNNSADTYHPFNNSTDTYHPLNNNIPQQHPVTETPNKQHPFNITPNKQHPVKLDEGCYDMVKSMDWKERKMGVEEIYKYLKSGGVNEGKVVGVLSKMVSDINIQVLLTVLDTLLLLEKRDFQSRKDFFLNLCDRFKDKKNNLSHKINLVLERAEAEESEIIEILDTKNCNVKSGVLEYIIGLSRRRKDMFSSECLRYIYECTFDASEDVRNKAFKCIGSVMVFNEEKVNEFLVNKDKSKITRIREVFKVEGSKVGVNDNNMIEDIKGVSNIGSSIKDIKGVKDSNGNKGGFSNKGSSIKDIKGVKDISKDKGKIIRSKEVLVPIDIIPANNTPLNISTNTNTPLTNNHHTNTPLTNNHHTNIPLTNAINNTPLSTNHITPPLNTTLKRRLSSSTNKILKKSISNRKVKNGQEIEEYFTEEFISKLKSVNTKEEIENILSLFDTLDKTLVSDFIILFLINNDLLNYIKPLLLYFIEKCYILQQEEVRVLIKYILFKKEYILLKMLDKVFPISKLFLEYERVVDIDRVGVSNEVGRLVSLHGIFKGDVSKYEGGVSNEVGRLVSLHGIFKGDVSKYEGGVSNEVDRLMSSKGDIKDIKSMDSRLEGVSKEIDDYKGVSKEIDDYKGVSKEIDDYKGVSKEIDDYKGVSKEIDDYKGVINNTYDYKGVSNTIDDYKGVSNGIDIQQGVSNSNDIQHSFNINTYEQHPFNNNSSNQQGVIYGMSPLNKRTREYNVISDNIKKVEGFKIDKNIEINNRENDCYSSSSGSKVIDKSFSLLNIKSDNYKDSRLEGDNYKDSKLEGDNYKDSKLEGDNYKDSKLEGDNYKDSRLEGDNYKDSKLEGDNYKDSRLEGDNYKDSSYKDSKLEGFSIRNSRLEGVSDKDSNMYINTPYTPTSTNTPSYPHTPYNPTSTTPIDNTPYTPTSTNTNTPSYSHSPYTPTANTTPFKYTVLDKFRKEFEEGLKSQPFTSRSDLQNILTRLIDSNTESSINAFKSLNTIIDNNISCLLFSCNSIVSSILIQLNEFRRNKKKENNKEYCIYILQTLFKLTKNSFFSSYLSLDTLKSIHLDLIGYISEGCTVIVDILINLCLLCECDVILRVYLSMLSGSSSIKGDRGSIKGVNYIGSSIKGDNYIGSSIKGDNYIGSSIKGDNYIGSSIKGVSDSSNQHPVNDTLNKQHPFNNIPDKQHPVNDTLNKQHPFNNIPDKQHPVNNTPLKQHPLNTTPDKQHPVNVKRIGYNEVVLKLIWRNSKAKGYLTSRVKTQGVLKVLEEFYEKGVLRLFKDDVVALRVVQLHLEEIIGCYGSSVYDFNINGLLKVYVECVYKRMYE